LGSNWGSHPKEDHELVTTGAYMYARHPIYAGAMLALFGSALTGSIVAAAPFLVSIAFSLRRINNEERDMLSLFPRQYSAYQAHTRRLIPLIW